MSVTEERDAWNVYEYLKVKMEVLVEQVETTLETPPIIRACAQDQSREHKESLG